MSKPQKYFSGLTATKEQPERAQKPQSDPKTIFDFRRKSLKKLTK